LYFAMLRRGYLLSQHHARASSEDHCANQFSCKSKGRRLSCRVARKTAPVRDRYRAAFPGCNSVQTRRFRGQLRSASKRPLIFRSGFSFAAFSKRPRLRGTGLSNSIFPSTRALAHNCFSDRAARTLFRFVNAASLKLVKRHRVLTHARIRHQFDWRRSQPVAYPDRPARSP
jgi:hypothetical protein